MADLCLGEDGILAIVHRENARIDPASTRQVIALHVSLAAGRKTPVLVDVRNVRHMDRESRELASGPDVAAVTSRLAIVVGNPVSAVIGNFFLLVSRPNYPTRLFTDDAAARAWLLQPDPQPEAGV